MTAAGQRKRHQRPLRILFAIHSPWDPRHGLPQGFIELMRQLQVEGYSCEKYSEEDAFRRPSALAWIRFPFTVALFQRKLLARIRSLGHRYDVIVADHRLLPFPRSRYCFSGLMVARSQGLLHFYQSYMKRRADGRRAGPLQQLGWWAGGGVEAADRSFRTADQIYLNNSDELAFVRDELGHGNKCVLVPNAITEERQRALAASCRIDRRLASVSVVMVGVWSARKGLEEIPGIIRIVRARLPSVRLRLLGTQFPAEQILRRFDQRDRDAVEVVPTFRHQDLPALVADARAGIFPSHVEGFGIGLLEMLAAGIPVVAWDVPGPRDIMEGISELPLVPAGDERRTAAELLRLLECGREEYGALSDACRARSREFTWQRVARVMEEVTLEPLAERAG